MHPLGAVAGTLLLLAMLRDAFETIVLPRQVRRRWRLSGFFYRTSWRAWRGLARRLRGSAREALLGVFGPLSLLLLIAVWALGIIVAFAILQWADGSSMHMAGHLPGFLDDLYVSGTTFFTLGLGDVTPDHTMAKVLVVTEAGIGFAFLAVVIGYMPVIYQAFSRREIAIAQLDARAGSPPAAGELLRRHGPDAQEVLDRLLVDWERWSAEVLESHLSYAVLGYFRSQHRNQSWLMALTTVLDTSALVMVGFEGSCARQARLTFAMARHAAVDIAQVMRSEPPAQAVDRLGSPAFRELVHQLDGVGIRFEPREAERQLADLRLLYEPYVAALSRDLLLPLPAWTGDVTHQDNWKAAPWKHLPTGSLPEEHF